MWSLGPVGLVLREKKQNEVGVVVAAEVGVVVAAGVGIGANSNAEQDWDLRTNCRRCGNFPERASLTLSWQARNLRT